MLVDCAFYLPTKIYFGKDPLSDLGRALEAFGPRVLLVYGKRSAKRIGLYDAVMKLLLEEKKEVLELSGVSPNPRYEQVLAGARLAKENKVDLILALGGSSVIDCAKAISVSAYCRGDAWEKYWVDQRPLGNKVIPVGAVLTLAGSGSEANADAVITNEAERIKEPRRFPPEVCPRFAILAPEFTYTLSQYQMSCGIFSALSHMLEQYLSFGEDHASDHILAGLMRSLIDSARTALKEPTSYDARGNIMWCAAMGQVLAAGITGNLQLQLHALAHQLSAYTDCAHGAALAAISIPYYRYIQSSGYAPRLARLATDVFGVTAAARDEGTLARLCVDRLEGFICELELPLSLKALGASKKTPEQVVQSVELCGTHRYLSRDELSVIMQTALNCDASEKHGKC